ncbi:MAG: PspC domain-containing protein [Chloroflexi bacterium]|nr:PspC domain-containing protein [Chloroflexota bacterium]
MTKRLVKSTDKKLFGVAGGVAEYFDIDPILVRVGFVVLCVGFFFLGLVAYVALAIMMPSPAAESPADDYASPGGTEDEQRNRNRLLGWALVSGGLLIVVTKLAFFSWASWWMIAVAFVAAGAAVLVNRTRRA